MAETKFEKAIRQAEDRWFSMEDAVKYVARQIVFVQFRDAQPVVTMRAGGELIAEYNGHTMNRNCIVERMKEPGYITPDDFN